MQGLLLYYLDIHCKVWCRVCYHLDIDLMQGLDYHYHPDISGFGADGCGVATNCQQCTDAPGCGVCLSNKVLLCINSTKVGEHCTGIFTL